VSYFFQFGQHYLEARYLNCYVLRDQPGRPTVPHQVADGIAAALTAKLFGTSGVHVMVNPSAEEIDPDRSAIQLRKSS